MLAALPRSCSVYIAAPRRFSAIPFEALADSSSTKGTVTVHGAGGGYV
jgi:hypothetical protein